MSEPETIPPQDTAARTPARLHDELRRSPPPDTLQHGFDAMFERPRPGLAGVPAQADPGPLMPEIDVSEAGKAARVVAEIPGARREDTKITVFGPSPTVRGREDADCEEEGRDRHLAERRTGSFRRAIPLGFEPEEDAMTARFEDGVPSVEVRKPSQAACAVRRTMIA